MEARFRDLRADSLDDYNYFWLVALGYKFVDSMCLGKVNKEVELDSPKLLLKILVD